MERFDWVVIIVTVACFAALFWIMHETRNK